MAEQINIATLSIDTDSLIKESAKLKREIDTLRKAQKQLDTTTEEGALAYAAAEVEIKKLSKAYKDNTQLAVALDQANEDLEKTMSAQNKSTQELYDSRAQLQKIAKSIVGDSEEEIALRKQLNEAIDAQTAAIREQSADFIKGKDSIGEYTKGIDASDLSLLAFANRSVEAGGATNLLRSGIDSAKKSIISLTGAMLKFIATPAGVVLATIAGAFLLIKNAMDRSEDASNKIKKEFGALSGIASKLLSFLEPLGAFLIDGLVAGFELVEKGVSAVMDGIQAALEFLGFEDAAASLGGFKEEMNEAAEAGKRLVEAELALTKAQRIAQRTQLEYQKQAEKLRQIRDDETKQIGARMRANKELGEVLNKQLNEELVLAQKALDYANLRIQLDGKTKENLDSQAEALTEIADIEERITGQQSEQLTNRVALQKEAAEKAIAIQEAQLEMYLKSEDVRAKSLKESLEVEKEASRQKIKILDAELRAKLIGQEQYNAKVLAINNELLKKQAELAVDNAKRELDSYIKKNQSKIDSDKFYTESILKEEQKRLNEIANAERNFQAKKLEEGVISQQEYNDSINEINEANRLQNEEAEKERAEAEKEQKAINAANELEILEQKTESDYEREALRLEASRLQEIEAAEKSGADVDLINKKYSLREDAINKTANEAKIKGYQSVLDSYVNVLGEQTAVGKAAAIASTIISTYEAAQSAFSSLAAIPIIGVGLGAAAAAAAVVSGFQRVGKITGTPTTFAKGDILKGKSHKDGGIPFSVGGLLGFEAEGGEAIINKKSTSMFAPLLSAINVAGGGKKFAEGGIAGVSSSMSGGGIIDYDLLADRISEANQSIPPPQVSVVEISEVANNLSVVEDLAQL